MEIQKSLAVTRDQGSENNIEKSDSSRIGFPIASRLLFHLRKSVSPAFRLLSLGCVFLVMGRVSGTGATFVVSSANDNGAGTLRQAILDANAAAGADLITFSLPGFGVRTITLFTQLPNVTDPVSIDATTQPGFGGVPVVELNGSLTGTNAAGLIIFADNCLVRGLVINRFALDGIRIQNGSGSRVEGNLIGCDSTGKFAFGNGDGGVTIFSSFGNTIGGTNAAQRNVLAGRNRAGVFLVGGASGNKVQGNYIGVDITGVSSLANTNGGVVINGASGNTIGGTAVGARNIISGNNQVGILVFGNTSVGNSIQGNYIGLDASGSAAMANEFDGILIDGAVNTLIGGTQAGARNVISANANRGIFIRGAGSTGTVIQGNYIGTEAFGVSPLGNAFSGIGISSVPGNIIGGAAPGARNIIAGNSQSGVSIEGGLASNNIVQGNYIGVDVTGRRAVGNGFYGVIVAGAAFNRIGGQVAGAGNVISANSLDGLYLVDARANLNTVQGNLIGTDAAGTNALGNHVAGVRIEAANNLIGGTNILARNVISANGYNGVYISGNNATNNTVAGNFIGTDITGKVAMGNAIAGIGISDAPRNLIGGTELGAGNLISANADNDFGSGIYIDSAGATNNAIQGNYIGCDVTGTIALANKKGGIYIYGSDNTLIGGTVPGARNLISGNHQVGISLGDGANGTTIQNNYIGTKANGTAELGNELHNIDVGLFGSANKTTIGGSPSTANRIGWAHIAPYTGVRVRSETLSTNNSIRCNAILENAGLGIDLGDSGIDANDACDVDNGANRLQNNPALTSASGRYITTVQGTLNSRANNFFTLDFYSNRAADTPLDYGEGEVWVGSTVVLTSSGCTVNFSVSFTNSYPVGPYIKATATDNAGNTSEFGAGIPVTSSPDTDGDGMPDDFEQAFGLNPNANDAAGDADGDGRSNIDEFRAGTRPNDASSKLQLKLLRIDWPRVFLGFDSVLGKTYRIEYSTSLPASWVILSSGIAGTGSQIAVTDLDGASQRFYRLRVEP